MDEILEAGSNTPPEVDGIALDSALTFFKNVKNGNPMSKEALRHGTWFLYTVNEVRAENALDNVPRFAYQDASPEETAQHGIDMIESLRTPEGTASALNFMLIMQIVQMILQILGKFNIGGNEDGGTLV